MTLSQSPIAALPIEPTLRLDRDDPAAPHHDHLTSLNHRLLARAQVLDKKDFALLHAAFDPSLSRRKLAQLLGIDPGTLSRRIRTLLNRLADPTIAALIDHGHTLPPQLRQIATDRLIHRKPIRRIARDSAIPIRKVAAAIQYIRGWARGVSAHPT